MTINLESINIETEYTDDLSTRFIIFCSDVPRFSVIINGFYDRYFVEVYKMKLSRRFGSLNFDYVEEDHHVLRSRSFSSNSKKDGKIIDDIVDEYINLCINEIIAICKLY